MKCEYKKCDEPQGNYFTYCDEHGKKFIAFLRAMRVNQRNKKMLCNRGNERSTSMTKEIIAKFIMEKLKELDGFREAVYLINSEDAEEIGVTDVNQNEFVITIQQ